MKRNHKNTLVTLCCILFLAPLWINTAQAQTSGDIRTRTVTIGFTNEPLRDALFALGRAAGFQLVFPGTSVVDVTKPIDLPRAERTVEATLNLLLQGTNLDFEVQGNNVVLSERSAAATNSAEERTFTGRIIDEASGEGLPFATVRIRGTTTGTVTSMDGDFSLTAPANAVFIISFTGYETVEVPANAAQNVRMRLAATLLDVTEIVSTGFQQLSRERMTGSFAMITGDQMDARLQPSITSMIEGLAPGVVVTPGGQLEIRGVSTVMTSTAPLIVVDGFPLPLDADINTINPNNIESIVFLKDAVAASIYGSRSSNGVIVITTRTGSGRIDGGRDFSVTYRNMFGITMKPDLRLLNRASVPDFMDAEYELFRQNPNTPFNSFNNFTKIGAHTHLLLARDRGWLTEEEANARIAALEGVNALQQVNDHLIQRRTSQEHNLSLSSRSDVNQFGAAIRYVQQRGDIVTSRNDRITVDINNAWIPNNWLTVRTFSNINFTTFNNPGPRYTFNNIVHMNHNTDWIQPYTNMFDANGNPVPWFAAAESRQVTYDTFPGMRSVLYHPLHNINEERAYGNNLQTRLGGSIDVRFTDFLSGSVGGTWIRGANMNREVWTRDSYRMRLMFNDGTSRTNPALRHIPDGGMINENRGTANNWIFRSQINYQQNFNNFRHRLTGFVATEVMQEVNEISFLPTRFGYDPVSATFNTGFNWFAVNQNLNSIANDMLFARPTIAANLPTWSQPGTINSMGGNYTVRDQRRVSWMGNFSYEFNNTYIISGSIRWELSNFYGTAPQYRYRPTWSIGGTYKILNEPFMTSLRDVFDRFNVRATFGVLGSDVLNFMPYLVLGAGGHQVVTGGILNNIISWPNPYLRYERKRSLNIGTDLTLLRSRLDLTIDFYNNHSYDLITQEPVDPTKGIANVTLNGGELRNRGIEVSARANIIRTRNFEWTTSPLVNYNRTQVLRWDVTRTSFSIMGAFNGEPVMIPGYAADAFFGARFAGLNSSGQATWYLREPQRQPDGTYIYTMSSSAISGAGPDNAFFQGTSRPPLTMAWTNSFRFRNWEASFMFVGNFGHVYRRQAFDGRAVGGGGMNHRTVADRWRQPGDENHTIYPVLGAPNDWWVFPASDVLVTNANFVRLRDLTISYTLPREVVGRIGLNGVRVHAQGRNLLLFKHRDADIDPETARRMQPRAQTQFATGTMSGFHMPISPEIFFGVQITL